MPVNAPWVLNFGERCAVYPSYADSRMGDPQVIEGARVGLELLGVAE